MSAECLHHSLWVFGNKWDHYDRVLLIWSLSFDSVRLLQMETQSGYSDEKYINDEDTDEDYIDSEDTDTKDEC